LKIDPSKIRYFIANVNQPNYDQLFADAEAIHKTVLPDNNLSATLSKTETKALIKVAGMSGANVSDISNRGVVISAHTRADLPALNNMLQTPEWFIDTP